MGRFKSLFTQFFLIKENKPSFIIIYMYLFPLFFLKNGFYINN